MQIERYIKTVTEPHILCVGDKSAAGGSLYVIVGEHFISCGTSSLQAIDIFFKAFAVLGLTTPIQLKKIHDLLAIQLWRTVQATTSSKVQRLCQKLSQYEQSVNKN